MTDEYICAGMRDFQDDLFYLVRSYHNPDQRIAIFRIYGIFQKINLGRNGHCCNICLFCQLIQGIDETIKNGKTDINLKKTIFELSNHFGLN